MKKDYTFDDLVNIMKRLRGENGCPWDKEQTHNSLKRYFIEETYEFLETIDLGDREKMAEELGDIMLQVVFHAQIGDEGAAFNINDVINSICNKMISRHPHIFSDTVAKTSKDVLYNWDEIKIKEKNIKTHAQGLENVCSYLPALMRSYKVQQKAAKAGFDWDEINEAFSKVDEETLELKQAIETNNKEKIEEELGDLLFSVVNVSRFLDVEPELALTGTTEKFIKRFKFIENSASLQGRAIDDMSLAEMDILWEKSKKTL